MRDAATQAITDAETDTNRIAVSKRLERHAAKLRCSDALPERLERHGTQLRCADTLSGGLDGRAAQLRRADTNARSNTLSSRLDRHAAQLRGTNSDAPAHANAGADLRPSWYRHQSLVGVRRRQYPRRWQVHGERR